SRARIQWAVQFTGSLLRLLRGQRKEPTAGQSNTTGFPSLRCALISPTKKVSPAPWRSITRHQLLAEHQASHKGTKTPGAARTKKSAARKELTDDEIARVYRDTDQRCVSLILLN